MAAVLAFAVFLVEHAALYRALVIRRKLLVMLALWAANGAVYLAVYRLLPDDATYLPGVLVAPADVVTLLNGAFVYWCLFAVYYQFFNMADNSVSVRCLIELSRAPAAGLTLEELKRPYSFETMVGRRLARLVEAGYLERDGKHYRCTGKGRGAARLMRRLKAVLNLGPGG